MMNERTPSYRSYLLRMWREERGGEVIWRASLESAQTSEHWHFTTADDLFTFLRAQMGMLSASSRKHGENSL